MDGKCPITISPSVAIRTTSITTLDGTSRFGVSVFISVVSSSTAKRNPSVATSRMFFLPISQRTPVKTGLKLSFALANTTLSTAPAKAAKGTLQMSVSFFTSAINGNSSALMVWNFPLYPGADKISDSFSKFNSTFPGFKEPKNSPNILAGTATLPPSTTLAATIIFIPISRSVADRTSPSFFASIKTCDKIGSWARAATARETIINPESNCSCNTSIFMFLLLFKLLTIYLN